MNKYLIFALFLVALALGFYAFSIGIIILKAFIGLAFVGIFALGVYIGRLTKKS